MLLTLLVLALSSGSTIVLGGLIAHLINLHNHKLQNILCHTMMALGGGILSASVAFVLVPHGIEGLTPLPISITFLLGAATFAILDNKLSKSGHKNVQVLAMLMDFIPEVIALGATFSIDPKLGVTLALFIGLQNLPEGFNAYKELRKRLNAFKSFGILFLLSLSGVLPTILGYLWLSNQPELISKMMLFASGGILYLIFQDIIPMAKLNKTWAPALGGIVGFLIGILGYYYSLRL